MDWEREYFKKVEYAISLEHKIDQLERRIKAWEKARIDPVTTPITFEGCSPSSVIGRFKTSHSVCDEELAIMSTGIEKLSHIANDELFKEYLKTVAIDYKHDKKVRVHTLTLSCLMEKK